MKLTHLSLALVGLMWVLPFLYPYHAYPITTFYQEWLAGVLGLGAFLLLLSTHFWRVPQVPPVVLLPVGLILLAGLQYLMGRIVYFDSVLLLSLYLLYAMLLMLLAQHMRTVLGLPAVATALALVLLVGAELNTLAGILQHFEWRSFLDPYVTSKVSNAVYGNLAQPNHYAGYLGLGLVSLGFLYLRRSMPIWQVLLLATPILFVMTLSGSRSSWLYLGFMWLLAYLWQRRDKRQRSLMFYSLGLVVGYSVMHVLVQLPWLQGGGESVSAFGRLLAPDTSGGIRLHLWHESLLIFAHHPLLGAGFGQFAYQHFLLASELRDVSVAGLYNNAHNLVMHLAAEMGLAGLAILLTTLILWGRAAFHAERDAEHWWGFGMIGILAIHSMLEYPLWYGYFVAIAAFLLGLFDVRCYRLEMRNMGRLVLTIILLMGALSMFRMLQGYQHLESALLARSRADEEATSAPKEEDHLQQAYAYPFLRPYAELYIASSIEPTSERLQAKCELNERAQRFIPIAQVVYQQAWLLALMGRREEAEAQLKRAIWSYPRDYARMNKELEALARDEPVRFAPLLEFANLKYEEYRRAAVSAK